MTNRNYVNGANFERKVKKELEKNGWLVARTAGSHGVADLICITDNHPVIIQCKLNGAITNKEKDKLYDAVKDKFCLAYIAYREKDGRKYVTKYEEVSG